MPGKLHDDELETDADLVRRLLAAQHPQWADLPIRRFASDGTSNALYRLGNDLVARLPLRPGSGAAIGREHQWLPFLAPHLPLAVPTPVALGGPGEGYESVWSVYGWLDGESAATAPLDDPADAATALGWFVVALRSVDATDGPRPSADNYGRGCPLALRDDGTRQAIAELTGTIDTDAATAAWETALATPVWAASPVWLHGDLMPGNLLVDRGRLHAVIDFGGVGVGDPACDLQIAWNFFAGASRDAYRDAVEVDDDTWARGRGWALSVALLQLPYYATSNPAMARVARFTIDAVLADAAERNG